MKILTFPLSSILTHVFLLSLLLPFSASTSPGNSLSRGSSLSAEDESPALVSSDGSFSCCFHNVGSNAYTFSIWFSKSNENTTVWTANRDSPVNGHGSRIIFRKDGSVVLTNHDDAVVWSTNTSSTEAQRMKLLDSGNLVVVDGDDNDVFVSSRTRYNSSKYGVLDEKGQFLASDRLAFNASDWGPGISRRLTLDYDGNLRLYSLNESTGSWSITWAALQRMLRAHGLRGQNGILAYTPLPQCSCPPGYKMANTSDWNKGCKPKIEINCDNPHPFKFLELRNIDF
ncbi:uncharacterized protein A4U43_C02F860 [Asparagus officinalis]|uniref:Bulb-type lectin domain-containing protein n=1 Tax=Asparagus officinalis TaxID=4686 RepID=A0A5P1FET7_ASPOF|nr:uncharacterized protein A4U43_C02F860 [Asparagus officinalis]